MKSSYVFLCLYFFVIIIYKKVVEVRITLFKVLSSKLYWFLSTIDVLWEKIAALIEFS